MLIIIVAIVVVFLVSIIWIWHCFGDIDKNKKILSIIIGLLLVFILTFIIFQISKTGITYDKEEIQRDVQNILVSIFTAVNTLILLPYIAKQLYKVKANEINKEKFRKKMFFVFFIFLICLILESGYMRDSQQGILKIYQAYCKIM